METNKTILSSGILSKIDNKKSCFSSLIKYLEVFSSLPSFKFFELCQKSIIIRLLADQKAGLIRI